MPILDDEFLNSNATLPPDVVANTRLICAVIAQAYLDLRGGYGPRKAFSSLTSAERSQLKAVQTYKQEAAEWFASDDTHEFSFRWCCAAIDVNPDPLRVAADLVEDEKRLNRKVRLKAQVHSGVAKKAKVI